MIDRERLRFINPGNAFKHNGDDSRIEFYEKSMPSKRKNAYDTNKKRFNLLLNY